MERDQQTQPQCQEVVTVKDTYCGQVAVIVKVESSERIVHRIAIQIQYGKNMVM